MTGWCGAAIMTGQITGCDRLQVVRSESRNHRYPMKRPQPEDSTAATKQELAERLRKVEAEHRAACLHAAELKMQMILNGRSESELAFMEECLLGARRVIQQARCDLESAWSN